MQRTQTKKLNEQVNNNKKLLSSEKKANQAEIISNPFSISPKKRKDLNRISTPILLRKILISDNKETIIGKQEQLLLNTKINLKTIEKSDENEKIRNNIRNSLNSTNFQRNQIMVTIITNSQKLINGSGNKNYNATRSTITIEKMSSPQKIEKLINKKGSIDKEPLTKSINSGVNQFKKYFNFESLTPLTKDTKNKTFQLQLTKLKDPKSNDKNQAPSSSNRVSSELNSSTLNNTGKFFLIFS